MQLPIPDQQLPIYSLEPDESGNKNFRVYHFEGTMPTESDLLLPHRKDHYLFVFMRRGGTRHWIDMIPYELKDNTAYLLRPNQIIVKEGTDELWSTGIAFTREFLSLQENASLNQLALIQDSEHPLELPLSESDVGFVEDMLTRINAEYQVRSEWQQRMLTAYLTLLFTYISRIYQAQHKNSVPSFEKQLIKTFHTRINECFHELHEVADYASLLNISAGHLSETVKTQSGKPAIKHIHERLILEAKRLLFHTGNSLKEIAFELGFSDASYFNRFFKRETGATPNEYRINTRKMYH
ncbi:AraC family transcriptional regulator [Pedobacter metabolipauper]|uniref:AraC-like DNA-binding protein n=1 Tax=Pedobacter metabolipauper TaxID=425513 RepID=A0A4R6T2R0_9SPHI|nr:helix-turn-helix domain-containing protein [Pedobacter metabolipauper]TDQ11830.1 AraC-like DNA-binding protein [Pedobacter metabolipauper]